MENFLTLFLVLIVPTVAGLLFFAYIVLFFILRYHWKEFALNRSLTNRFLLLYGAIGTLLAAIMAVGVIGLFS